MKPTVNKKASLIRKYHTLCSKLGMTDEAKRQMLWDNFEVASSKDLYIDQLESLCRNLNTQQNRRYSPELDRDRKRVIAIFRHKCSIEGKSSDGNYAKSIACRAAGYTRFNDIPTEKLQELYRELGHKYSRADNKWVTDTLNNITEELSDGTAKH